MDDKKQPSKQTIRLQIFADDYAAAKEIGDTETMRVVLKWITKAIQATRAEGEAEAKLERSRILAALCNMYLQYCPGALGYVYGRWGKRHRGARRLWSGR